MPHPQGRVIGSPGEVGLLNAICYANKRELPILIDRAMTMGASLNRPDCYELNSLVIAVRANRSFAVSSLMARGALVPPAPPDGIDLLMEACKNAQVEMASALVEVAKMDPIATDQYGKTALHHAILGGSAEIVATLLDSGANPDTALTQLDVVEILAIFGQALPLSGKAVTPLMIAVALGSQDIVSALLDAGANPNLGAHSPLLIAAFNRDQTIFNELLARGATLLNCKELSGLQGLTACISARMPTEFLRKLVAQHNFDIDDGSIFSPLGHAVTANVSGTVALLMACDAPVEDHQRTDKPVTIWDKALEPGKFSSESANFLVARHPAQIINTVPEAQYLFGWILANIDKPATLASHGLFTSLIATAVQALKALTLPSTGSLQSSFAVAFTLRRNLPKLPPMPPNTDGESIARDEVWRARTARELRVQNDALFTASTTLIEHCITEMKTTTTLAFFLECHAACPKDVAMRDFIANSIIKISGVPDAVVQLIRNAWIRAAQSAKDWQVAPDSIETANRFLLTLARNLLTKGIEQQRANFDPLVEECLRSLGQAVPFASQALNQFCTDPVAWFRKFEGRNNLQDPAHDLAKAVQIELSLPPATCTAIVAVWRQALRAARTSQWTTPAELNRVLGAYVARNISEALFDAESKAIISDVASLTLQRWIAGAENVAAPGSRKRPAEAEAAGAPRHKEARN
jgi:ankyrin repeat protein